MKLNFFRWFENLKTQAKLLTVFETFENEQDAIKSFGAGV
jgi:hypothetical protein